MQQGIEQGEKVFFSLCHFVEGIEAHTHTLTQLVSQRAPKELFIPSLFAAVTQFLNAVSRSFKRPPTPPILYHRKKTQGLPAQP